MQETYDDILPASGHRSGDSPAWLLALPLARDAKIRQLLVVAGAGMDQSDAVISLHERNEDGHWTCVLSTPGFVGKSGMCPDADHIEDCARTPIGVYHFNKAFGIAKDPGSLIPYIRVSDRMYWSGDFNRHYNELVNIDEVPDLDMEHSEHLISYEYQYQYCLNISFNEEGTAGRGSAIFLHCLGRRGPFTHGCVAVPEDVMRMILRQVREDCVVVIDTMENLIRLPH